MGDAEGRRPDSDVTLESRRRPWSVLILSSREQPDELAATIDAAILAAKGHDSMIDIVVNGNAELAEVAGMHVRSIPPQSATAIVRVWYLALGDKAHAFNDYIHRLWPGSEIAFYIDGYAQAFPNALTALAAGLRESPYALAASGVPTYGRTAKALREELLTSGGFHGNLFAIRGTAFEQLRQRGVRLPLGMYRTDGMLGAVLSFGLDPATFHWDLKRIVVRGDATCRLKPNAPFSLKDIKTLYDRMVRQAWGEFITQAIKNHLALDRRPPEELPRTAVDLVEGWVRRFPLRAALLGVRRPLVIMAFRKRHSRDWSGKDIPPRLVAEVVI